MSSTITYTDINFGFPPTDPNVFSPVSIYYNLTLDKSKPWVRAEIMVNENKVYTIYHYHIVPDEAHVIQMVPVHPYPSFGIYLDIIHVYEQKYGYEATLRVYHEGQYTAEQVQAWCPRQEMTYVDK